MRLKAKTLAAAAQSLPAAAAILAVLR